MSFVEAAKLRTCNAAKRRAAEASAAFILVLERARAERRLR